MLTNSTFDYELIEREFYNPNNFDVIFDRILDRDTYVMAHQIKLGPAYVVLKPNCHLTLPHGYFRITGRGLPQGEPIKLTVNYGDLKRKGNKLPSIPITEFKRG